MNIKVGGVGECNNKIEVVFEGFGKYGIECYD